LIVVGGGAAGVYASIRAKTLAPRLNVVVIEKGRFLSKVKVSGGGRCNVTNGHHLEPMVYVYAQSSVVLSSALSVYPYSFISLLALQMTMFRDWPEIILGGTRSSEDRSLPLMARRIPCVGSQTVVWSLR